MYLTIRLFYSVSSKDSDKNGTDVHTVLWSLLFVFTLSFYLIVCYHVYPKYSSTLTPFNTHLKI